MQIFDIHFAFIISLFFSSYAKYVVRVVIVFNKIWWLEERVVVGSFYRQPGVTCWVIYTSECWHWALCQGSWSPCWAKYIPIVLSLAWCWQEKQQLQSEILSKIESFYENWATNKRAMRKLFRRKSILVLFYFSLSLYKGPCLLHPLKHWLKSVDLRLQVKGRQIEFHPGEFEHWNKVFYEVLMVYDKCKYKVFTIKGESSIRFADEN